MTAARGGLWARGGGGHPQILPLVQHLELDAFGLQDAAQPPVPAVDGEFEALLELCGGGLVN